MKITKPLACALLCAAVLNLEAAPATAQLASASMGAALASKASPATSQPVRYRYNRGYRSYSHNRGRGGNIGLGIGAAIIGGIILSEAARAEHRSADGGDWDRCAQTYRSFEPNTGLYTDYDGVRRTCPYRQ